MEWKVMMDLKMSDSGKENYYEKESADFSAYYCPVSRI
jgi:hypothetical protein